MTKKEIKKLFDKTKPLKKYKLNSVYLRQVKGIKFWEVTGLKYPFLRVIINNNKIHTYESITPIIFGKWKEGNNDDKWVDSYTRGSYINNRRLESWRWENFNFVGKAKNFYNKSTEQLFSDAPVVDVSKWETIISNNLIWRDYEYLIKSSHIGIGTAIKLLKHLEKINYDCDNQFSIFMFRETKSLYKSVFGVEMPYSLYFWDKLPWLHDFLIETRNNKSKSEQIRLKRQVKRQQEKWDSVPESQYHFNLIKGNELTKLGKKYGNCIVAGHKEIWEITAPGFELGIVAEFKENKLIQAYYAQNKEISIGMKAFIIKKLKEMTNGNKTTSKMRN